MTKQPDKEATEEALKQDKAKYKASIYSNPVTSTAFAIRNNYIDDNIDFLTIAENLTEQLSRLKKGDTTRLESMLFVQAVALQELFNKGLAQVGHAQTLNGLKAWGELALRAQAQSRKTLALLMDIKSPKQSPMFIKQQNNAINQVNQCDIELQKAQIHKNENPVNELLSEIPHETLDIRRKDQAVKVNTKMETVAKSRREDS